MGCRGATALCPTELGPAPGLATIAAFSGPGTGLAARLAEDTMAAGKWHCSSSLAKVLGVFSDESFRR